MRQIICAAALCLVSGTASASTWGFSYLSSTGSTLGGLVDGTLQDDGGTIFVSAIEGLSWDGIPGPDLPYIWSVTDFVDDTGAPPVVTLSGDVMSVIACSLPDCGESSEGLFMSFAGLVGGGGDGFVTTAGLGGFSEVFDPANYTILQFPDQPPQVIPLPASILLLAGALAMLSPGAATRGILGRRNRSMSIY